MALITTVDVVGYVPPKRRPVWMVRLGCRMLPESITEAWYVADCPPRLNAREAGIPMSERLAWRMSCWLRGCRKGN